MRPAWIEVDLSAIEENIRAISRFVGPTTAVMAVVKANAYGHGLVPVAQVSRVGGASTLGVAILDEALTLRDAGVDAPILIMGCGLPEHAPEIIERRISQVVTNREMAEALSREAIRRGTPALIHVKVDTGMGRLGIACKEVARVAEKLAASPLFELEGLYTHFASSEDFTSNQTDEQVRRFEEACAGFAARGLRPPHIHLANTGALVARPETWGTMVRPGSVLYGFHSFFKFPEGEDRTAEFAARLPVQPVLTLKGRVYTTRDYPAQAPLGYGARFVTQRASRIAVLPIGYGHGWRRGLSGHCRVIVRGCYAPTVGTIGMDLTLADFTDVPGIEPGEEVILIGSNGTASIPPTEPARVLGTVCSEVLSGLNKRIPRIYCD